MLIFYDDRATVEKYYPVVKAYIDYLLQGVDERGVLITPGHDYGDWVAPIGCDDAWNKANSACSSRTDGRTHCPECGENGTDLSPNPPSAKHVGLLLSTAQLLEDLQMFIDAATALGHEADIANYSCNRTTLLGKFRRQYYNQTGSNLFEDQCGVYQEFDPDPRLAQYRSRRTGHCLNGTLLTTLDVVGQGQCCSACTNHATCVGWTFRPQVGGDGATSTCKLMHGRLTNEAPSNATTECISGVLDNTTSTVGLQTLNSVALQIGAAGSDVAAQKIVDAIAHDALATHDAHVTTGLMGTRVILPALSSKGHGEAAMRLVNQTTMPSWGAMVAGPLLGDMADSQPKPGTIWEEYGGAGSVNHPALTSFEPWFFNTLGGIRPTAPGFARSIVAPQILGNLTSVDASFDTVAGPLRCSWAKTHSNLSVTVTIPPNTESTVTLPTGDAASQDLTVTESGTVVWQRGKFVAAASPGVISGRRSDGGAFGQQQPGVTFEIGSGRYTFVVVSNGTDAAGTRASALLNVVQPSQQLLQLFGTASAGAARMPGNGLTQMH